MKQDNRRFFLKLDIGGALWKEVSLSEFVKAERAAGFLGGDVGTGRTATGCFTGGGIKGRVDYGDANLPVSLEKRLAFALADEVAHHGPENCSEVSLQLLIEAQEELELGLELDKIFEEEDDG